MSETVKPIFDGLRMKPMMILPPDTMSEEDLKLIRDNGICAVVAKDPARVKFIDPLPSVGGRDKIETAAIALSRRLLKGDFPGNGTYRGDISKMFVDLLVGGTALDHRQDAIEEFYTTEKWEETRRIAREDARAEAKARKEAKAAAEKAKAEKKAGA